MTNGTKSSSLLFGSLFCGLSVAAGAFGAHGLQPVLDENGKGHIYGLAVQYQFYHGMALLFIGLLQCHYNHKCLKWAMLSIIFGTACFSGSLYFLSFLTIGKFALLTPIGGVFLLIGWSLLVYFGYISYFKRTEREN